MELSKKKKIKEQTAEGVWQQYERGKDYLLRFDYYNKTEKCYKFYNGDQWDGLKAGGERFPVLNVLEQIVNFKVATVAQNGMAINYGTMNYGDDYAKGMQVCDKLNSHAAKMWERLKLDQQMWNSIEDGAIAGSNFLYFFYDETVPEKMQVRSLDGTMIHLSDEQEQDIQKQKYIIVVQRLFVSDIKEQAKANGISEDKIRLITPDEDLSTQIGDKAKEEIKQDNEDGKCICLLKLWKQDGAVHMLRSTRHVIYEEPYRIEGMKLYPIAQYRWKSEKGSARGVGEVWNRIPNQIEVNKTLARNIIAVKKTAYPHMVYDSNKLSQGVVDRLGTVGATIPLGDVSGISMNDDVRKYIGYLTAPPISPQAMSILNELMTMTKELAGAGEAITGNINPERASGAAIMAVRDASALPLNNQAAAFKQFVEDIALIWFDMWVAYNPMGMEIVIDELDEITKETNPTPYIITAEELQALQVDVRIDVSPNNPYSKYAREQSLERALEKGYITFPEYVESLDDDSAAPKDKLKEIVEKQKKREEADLIAREQMAEEERKNLMIQQGTGQVPFSMPEQQAANEEAVAKANATIEQLLNENAALKAGMNNTGGGEIEETNQT